MRNPLGSLAVALLVAVPAAAQIPLQVTIQAEDSKSISALSGTNWNDNRVRAEYGFPGHGHVDGLLRFDFSAVPAGATIQTLQLDVWHEAALGSPSGSPAIDVYRVDDDSWSRGATDPHPGLAQLLTWAPQGGIPSQNLFPVSFPLDSGAASWAIDIADGKLSLALRNVTTTGAAPSYAYFFGSDPFVPGVQEPPVLTVNYFPSPVLALTGSCPGPGSIDGMGMTPGGTVLLGYGFVGGGWIVPGGACAGALVQIGQVPIPLPGVPSVTADGSGNFSIPVTIPPAACLTVILVGFDVSTCFSTNSVVVF